MSGIGPAMDDVMPTVTQTQATASQPAQPATVQPAVTPVAHETAAATSQAAPATGAAAAQPVAQAQADTTATATRGVSCPVRPAPTAQVAARPATPANGVDAGSIGGAVFSLLLIIGLILGLGWLAKRMPGMKRGANAAQLKVVASVALGPRERAVVLDVGGQQLLVGVGQGGVRTLHTLEHPLPVVESTTPSPFAQVLAQHFGRKS